MSAILNIPELMDRVEHDHEFVIELIAIFKQVSPIHMKSVVEAVAREDYQAAQREAHTLKGMLLNLSATRAAAAASALEKLGHAGNKEGMDSSLGRLEKELALLFTELENRASDLQP